MPSSSSVFRVEGRRGKLSVPMVVIAEDSVDAVAIAQRYLSEVDTVALVCHGSPMPRGLAVWAERGRALMAVPEP